MSYDPTLGRWIEMDPATYIDGPNMYPMERSNPVRYTDPLGLQAQPAGPATKPTSQPTAHSGTAKWGSGDSAMDVSWSIKDMTGSSYNAAMGTGGPTVMPVVLVKNKPKCACEHLVWIQYTEARKDGQVFVGPNNHLPWVGIDRYPNNARTDPDPYVFKPNDQAATNSGNAFGRLQGAYDTNGANSVFVDWASSGGATRWQHFAVLTLICQKGGKDYRVGGLVIQWSADAAGNINFGGRDATDTDWNLAEQDFKNKNPDYLKNTFGGPMK